MMEKMKKNKIIIIGIILYLFNILLLLDMSSRTINKRFLIAFIIENFLLVFLYFFVYKKRYNIEKKFIVSFTVIGLFYLFLFPIGSLPDEINHFMRGYEISKGNLISTKCKAKNGNSSGCTDITKEIEKAIIDSGGKYSTNKKAFEQKYNKNSKKYKSYFTNISMYSFICYTPQALGIFIGRILHLPILLWAYLARLFNFLVFVLLLNFSIKVIPYKKNVIMFIALLPITIQEVVSIAADCMAIGSAIALISYVLYLKESKKKIEKKQIILLFILSLMLSMSKLVYLPMCIFTLLIPVENFGSKKKKYIIIGLIIAVVGILNLIWLKIASDFLLSISGGADPDEQLKYIIENPFSYVVIVYNSIVTYFDWYLGTMLGSSLGLFYLSPSPIYIKSNILLLLLLILFNNDVKIKKEVKILSLLIFCIVVMLIFTSLYLDWTVVGNSLVEGIQGRYFIPILFLFVLVLSSTNFKIKNTEVFNTKTLLLFMIMENIYILTYIIYSY